MPETPQHPAPHDGPLLETRDCSVRFPVRGGLLRTTRSWVHAVREVSIRVGRGETLGLVGESGCGKTTLGKAICRLYPVWSGTIRYRGDAIEQRSQRQLRPYRRKVQMVFQDPVESLNARETVANLIEEPLVIHRIGDRRSRAARVSELLDQVGLPESARNRFPFEFSGGQRQRIGIARALALNPELIVCDEPVSALDVSVQSQILNLLLELQERLALSYLFISHDLSVVRHVSDRIAVMYLGEVVEEAPTPRLFEEPLHYYTRSLISAIPRHRRGDRRERLMLRGEIPSPIDLGPGCAFAARSPLPHSPEDAALPAREVEVSPGHRVHVHPATVENPERFGWGGPI